MKQGYGVFGRAFKVMLENDVHDVRSIDHQFLREMILLDEESREYLYSQVKKHDMKGHELYAFAQQFLGSSEQETLENILKFTTDIVRKYNVDFKDMLFGGREKEILDRGTDWCADMARVGAVLAQCCGIPCRMVHLGNPEKAYNGHVVCEAYYEGKYGVADFLCGVLFYEDGPVSARELLNGKTILEGFPEEYRGYYSAIAINEYDPMDPKNDYTISKPNRYCMDLIYKDHGDQWFMGENIDYQFRKIDKDTATQLIELSRKWEEEDCTYGLVANSESDLEEPLAVALDGEKIVGYIFGHFYTVEERTSYIAVGEKCFSVDELYISPEYRRLGVGKRLYRMMEAEVENKCAYITLSTSTKNYKAILHLYVEELGMDFHSAFLIKKNPTA